MQDPEEYEKEQAALRKKFQPHFDAAARRRGEPDGQQDIKGLSRCIDAFAAKIAANGKNPEAERPVDYYLCETLRPGDFSEESFHKLAAFQRLLQKGHAANVELRVNILHRKDAIVCQGQEPSDAAIVHFDVYVPNPYELSFLSISEDKVSGLPSQHCSLNELKLQPPEADTVKTAQAVAVRRPLAFRKS